MPRINKDPINQLNNLAQQKGIKINPQFSSSGTQNNEEWTVDIEFDGTNYTGKGSSKPEAKKVAAIKILKDHGYT
ncbi:hypothetical protein CVT24_005075 [Panaeolus cyanescens]|uniref:DRBM domain-containing protein n=1 Tax=Panaeolus cyanescens TaxID=181874 RepID=A0A409VPM2_9AGAR|nr:hypothetical protein CVT24_005075 [Panaeolus cyanescens]